jgi:hypothetical protein
VTLLQSSILILEARITLTALALMGRMSMVSRKIDSLDNGTRRAVLMLGIDPGITLRNMDALSGVGIRIPAALMVS